MNDENKTKEQLIEEIIQLRKNISELEDLKKDEKYKILYKNSRDAIMILDPKKGFTAGNPACIEMFQCKDESDFTSKTPWELSPEYQPDGILSSQKAADMIKIALEKGNHFFEWMHRRSNGKEFPATVLLTKMSIYNNIFLQAIVRDITGEQVLLDDVIRQKNRALKYLNTAGVMFVEIGNDQKVKLINNKGCEILGYSKVDVIGKNWFDNFLPESVKEEVKSIFNKILRKDITSAQYYENPIINKKGEERMIAWSITHVEDENGRIIGILSSGEDVTERKRIETLLKESEEQYVSLINSIPVGLYRNTPGPKGKFTMANLGIAHMFGYDTIEEFMKISTSDLYADPSKRLLFSKKLLKLGEVKDEELLLKKKDGTFFWAAITAKINYDEGGNIKYFNGMIDDISERKNMEEDINFSLSALKSFKDATINRELRMIELKKEVNKLCGELGKSAVYDLSFVKE